MTTETMTTSGEVSGNSNQTAVSMKDDQQKRATADDMMYPHLQLLSRLQAISSTRNDADDDNTTEDPSADDQQQHEQSNNEWDLSTDALLATLLHEFSSHMQSRTHHVSLEIQALQNSVNQVGVEVGLVQQQWMKKSHDICMEQVVGEDDDSEEGDDDVGTNKKLSTQQQQQQEEADDDDEDDDSSADIARLEAEEKAAIQNGMKALSLFFDPKRKSKKKETDEVGDNEDDISEDDNNIVISTEEDNMIGDNCYYYPAAEADGFNQRPLPFIIGSREFMESCSVGDRGGLIEETL